MGLPVHLQDGGHKTEGEGGGGKRKGEVCARRKSRGEGSPGRRGGDLCEIPSMVGVRIFSGTTQCQHIFSLVRCK